MLPEVKALIEHYDLKPLPVESTLFLSTYRSKQEFCQRQLDLPMATIRNAHG
jgi:hypothetical protein